VLSRASKIQNLLSIVKSNDLNKMAAPPMNLYETLDLSFMDKPVEPGEQLFQGRLNPEFDYVYVLQLENLDKSKPKGLDGNYPQIINEETGEPIFNWYIGRADNPVTRWIQHRLGRMYLSTKGYKLLSELLKTIGKDKYTKAISEFLIKIKDDPSYFSVDPIEKTFGRPGDRVGSDNERAVLSKNINKILDLDDKGAYGAHIPGSARCGSRWTIIHKPIKMVYLKPTVIGTTGEEENILTRELINQYGELHVRGGSWCHILGMHKDLMLQHEPYDDPDADNNYYADKMKNDEDGKKIINYLNEAAYISEEEVVESISGWKISALKKSFKIKSITTKKIDEKLHLEERESILSALSAVEGSRSPLLDATLYLGYANISEEMTKDEYKTEIRRSTQRFAGRIAAHKDDPEGPINVSDYERKRPTKDEMRASLDAARKLNMDDPIWQGVHRQTARGWLSDADIELDDYDKAYRARKIRQLKEVLDKSWDYSKGIFNKQFALRTLVKMYPRDWSAGDAISRAVKRFNINYQALLEQNRYADIKDIKEAIMIAEKDYKVRKGRGPSIMQMATEILMSSKYWGPFWVPPMEGAEPAPLNDSVTALRTRIEKENNRKEEEWGIIDRPEALELQKQRGPYPMVEGLTQEAVRSALERTGGMLGCAAKILGENRRTLKRRMEGYGYKEEEFRKPKSDLTPESIREALNILTQNDHGETINWEGKIKSVLGCLASILGSSRSEVRAAMINFEIDINEFAQGKASIESEPLSLVEPELPEEYEEPEEAETFEEPEEEVLAGLSRWLELRKFAINSGKDGREV